MKFLKVKRMHGMTYAKEGKFLFFRDVSAWEKLRIPKGLYGYLLGEPRKNESEKEWILDFTALFLLFFLFAFSFVRIF